MKKAAIIAIALIMAAGCRTKKVTVDTRTEKDTTSKIEKKTETETNRTIEIDEYTDVTIIDIDTADREHTLEEILNGSAKVKPSKIVYINKSKKERNDECEKTKEKVKTEEEMHEETESEENETAKPSGDIKWHLLAYILTALSIFVTYKYIKDTP